MFVAAPAAAFRQELNQSPLLFRESSISPDQEERIRRKDAIIQTRNAQVAALWDELHTKLPWRNAVAGRKPIQPFPAEQEEEDRRQAAKQGNQTDLVLFIAVNTVGGWLRVVLWMVAVSAGAWCCWLAATGRRGLAACSLVVSVCLALAGANLSCK